MLTILSFLFVFAFTYWSALAGIPGFNRYLQTKPFENAFHPVKPDSFRSGSNGASLPPVDHLCFDMASALHECLKEGMTPPTLFQRLYSQLDKVIKEINPCQSVVFAFDGVAPYAKMTTQRKRRASGSISTMLTPGTDLMYDMESNLMTYIMQRSHRHHPQLRFFISGPNDPVEGEVKIVQWIMEHVCSPDEHVLIVGADGDLIVQCLLLGGIPIKTNSKNHPASTVVYHAFPNLLLADHGFKRKSFIRNMTRIHDTFLQLIGISPSSNDITSRSHAIDIALILLFLGNDYLPRLNMGTLSSALDILAMTWQELPVQERHLFDPIKKEFNWPTLLLFLRALSGSGSGSKALMNNDNDDNFYQGQLSIARADPVHLIELWRQRQKYLLSWQETSVSSLQVDSLQSYLVPILTYTNTSLNILPLDSYVEERQDIHHNATKRVPWSRKAIFSTDNYTLRFKDSYTMEQLQQNNTFQKLETSGYLYSLTAKLTIPSTKNDSASVPKTKVYQNTGLYRSLRSAKRALSLQMLLDSSLLSPQDQQLFVHQLYRQENVFVDYLQKQLDTFIDEYNAQIDGSNGINGVQYRDFVTFLRHHPNKNAILILRRLDVNRIRSPIDDDIECYLAGLLWVMDMYSTGRCNDFGYQYSRLFRPSISPEDIVMYCDRKFQQYSKSQQQTSNPSLGKDSKEIDQKYIFQEINRHVSIPAYLQRLNRKITRPVREDICAATILPIAAARSVPLPLRPLWESIQTQLFSSTTEVAAAENMKAEFVMDLVEYDELIARLEKLTAEHKSSGQSRTGSIVRSPLYSWKMLRQKATHGDKVGSEHNNSTNDADAALLSAGEKGSETKPNDNPPVVTSYLRSSRHLRLSASSDKPEIGSKDTAGDLHSAGHVSKAYDYRYRPSRFPVAVDKQAQFNDDEKVKLRRGHFWIRQNHFMQWELLEEKPFSD